MHLSRKPLRFAYLCRPQILAQGRRYHRMFLLRSNGGLSPLLSIPQPPLKVCPSGGGGGGLLQGLPQLRLNRRRCGELLSQLGRLELLFGKSRLLGCCCCLRAFRTAAQLVGLLQGTGVRGSRVTLSLRFSFSRMYVESHD